MQQSGVGYCEFLVGRGNGRALENVSPGAFQDRALCYVGDQAALYRLDKFSLAEIDPPHTIATGLGAEARGRWSRVTELSSAQPGSRLLANGTRFSSIIEQAPSHFHTLDNAVDPNVNRASTVWGYTRMQATARNYAGRALRSWQLARTAVSGGGDRGHCLSIFPNGAFLISTTERVGDPDNNTESFYIVPPGYADGEFSHEQVRRITAEELFGHRTNLQGQGARFVAQFTDGTVLLGGTGGFVRIPYQVLLDSTQPVSGYGRWFGNGAFGEIPQFDCAVDPRNPDWVCIEGYNQVFWFNFSGTPGLINSVRMAMGSNIGDTTDGGWPGNVAFDGEYSLWKPRGKRADVICLTAAQQDLLPIAAFINPVAANPVPAKILTSAAFRDLDPNIEGLLTIDFDKHGNARIGSFRWLGGPCHIFGFTAAQMAAAGEQVPAYTMTNAMPTLTTIRHAVGEGMYLR